MTADRLVLAMAQLDPVVGDIPGNLAKIRAARAAASGADLVLTPELSLVGYPPEDLVLKPAFVEAARAALDALAADTADGGPALLVGLPWPSGDARRPVHNAVALLDGGRVVKVQAKHDLPNYGVFDEVRVFAPGPLPEATDFRGIRLGLLVCEDMWTAGPTAALAKGGAELILVPNGSPYEQDKVGERAELAALRAAESRLPLVYVNQVGGQDELVFDGASFVLDASGGLRVQLPAFAEAVRTVEFRREAGRWVPADGPHAAVPRGPAAVYGALVLGLRSYVEKNRFPGVILGLSGGIDSALAAALAVDALGPDRVRAVMMPSPYTSQDSLDDAEDCARRLGIRLDTVSIGPAMAAFDTMLGPLFEGRAPDVTEENLQSRARGVALMALSNKFGHMVLSTGNKSEMSAGYATLYGDMCGGYAILKDVYKTTVYAISEWRNTAVPEGGRGPAGVVIPERILTKAPSAELKPDQTDQDNLPPYEVLDAILHGLVEEEATLDQIVARGLPPADVERTQRL
ncbi:MAG TPA: NAD+ synthase, partial [Alphaproteobacteria bacterium]|nr:NAD+ synthase [Alphaproteobacteria bacterium]